ncbi:ABC transporter ATP-binding protein [Sulfurospirillum arcachonense]|uniref:ABC transporter ATP-binding protein n=1 Tax=Sulfurospirillum arcachonense TaxID=57666 RepID=UPI000469F6BA|nr:ABC transporter ATP-binding protein [Sulfurospirillum arcachonense]
MSLLEVKNLSHSFDYQLFSDINFSLNKQESIAIVGVSGSGKSTLLHICATLLKPQAGSVTLLDKNLYEQKSKEILKIRREDIGIIFQSHYLFKGFNTFENIELATLLNNTTIDTELLKHLGIENLMDQKIGELSGGQQQRVSIARVLSKKPKIIFADEPTGNLDNKTANEVMDILFSYIKKNNAALLLVTHDMTLANRCNSTMKCSL